MKQPVILSQRPKLQSNKLIHISKTKLKQKSGSDFESIKDVLVIVRISASKNYYWSA